MGTLIEETYKKQETDRAEAEGREVSDKELEEYAAEKAEQHGKIVPPESVVDDFKLEHDEFVESQALKEDYSPVADSTVPGDPELFPGLVEKNTRVDPFPAELAAIENELAVGSVDEVEISEPVEPSEPEDGKGDGDGEIDLPVEPDPEVKGK